MRKILPSVILIVLLSSCTAISSLIHDDQVVARVGKHKLYRSEVEQYIPDLSTPADSSSIAQRYINSWAMEFLYINVAGTQLSKAEMDVSSELEAYVWALIK